MKNINACFSRKSDDWRTPKKMYDFFTKRCGFFDPCPYQCESFDGLSIDWPLNVFCNPPYSQIDKWVDKAIHEHHKNFDSEILLLVPARTDTKWFYRLYCCAKKIVFFRGRLKFNDVGCAPFPSCLVTLHHSGGESCCSFSIIDKNFYEF